MTQIVLDINEKQLQTLQEQADVSGTTPQKWLENLICQHLSPEWPDEIRAMIGAWSGDFPEPETLRNPPGKDFPRESL